MKFASTFICFFSISKMVKENYYKHPMIENFMQSDVPSAKADIHLNLYEA